MPQIKKMDNVQGADQLRSHRVDENAKFSTMENNPPESNLME